MPDASVPKIPIVCQTTPMTWFVTPYILLMNINCCVHLCGWCERYGLVTLFWLMYYNNNRMTVLPPQQKSRAIHGENQDKIHLCSTLFSAFASGWCSISYILTSAVWMPEIFFFCSAIHQLQSRSVDRAVSRSCDKLHVPSLWTATLHSLPGMRRPPRYKWWSRDARLFGVRYRST